MTISQYLKSNSNRVNGAVTELICGEVNLPHLVDDTDPAIRQTVDSFLQKYASQNGFNFVQNLGIPGSASYDTYFVVDTAIKRPSRVMPNIVVLYQFIGDDSLCNSAIVRNCMVQGIDEVWVLDYDSQRVGVTVKSDSYFGVCHWSDFKNGIQSVAYPDLCIPSL